MRNKSILHTKIDSKIIFSLIVALVPIMAAYASPFPGVYLEELLLIIMTLVASIKSKENNSKSMSLYILAIEIILSFMINLLFDYGQTTNVFVRTIRMLFYIVCITYTSSRLLVLDKTIKATVYIGILSVAFLIIQVIVFRTTGIYIKGNGYILPLAYRADFDYQYYMNMMFRPSSFFSEPAAMTEYLLVPLSYLLLAPQKSDNKGLIVPLFLSFGFILTTSLWGLVILVAIWLIWLIRVSDISKQYIFIIVIIPISIYIAVNTSSFSTMLSRTDISSIGAFVNSNTFSGRFLGYEALESMSVDEKLFGLGFGNLGIREQLGTGNSLLYYILGLGYVGTVIFYIACVLDFVRMEVLWQRVVFGMMIILSFGAGIFNTCMIVYFMTISIYPLKNSSL